MKSNAVRIKSRYGNIQQAMISKKVLLSPFKGHLIKQEAKIKQKFKFSQEQLLFLIRNKPSILLFDDEYRERKSGILAVYQVFHKEMNFTRNQVKALILRYPAVISLSVDELHTFFKLHRKLGFNDKQTLALFNEVPMIISQSEKKYEDVIFLFNLYFKMEPKHFVKIYREFPFMICLDRATMQAFLGQFKKYKFTPAQLINVCTKSGGVLGQKLSNLTGLFETCKMYGISAKEVLKILDVHPEFVV